MELNKEELIEMMSIFRIESEEHLKNLNKGLLSLEEKPGSKELLDELFRTAHSIKGAARMMGFGKIESVAHKIEDIFGLIRKGSIKLTPSDFDGIYEGVDVISRIIETISQEGSDQDIDINPVCGKLAAMAASVPAEQPESNKLAETAVSETLAPVETVNQPAIEAVKTDEVKNAVEQTPVDIRADEDESELTDSDKPEEKSAQSADDNTFIRVHTRRMDDLMNQVSELVTSRIKTQQRLIDLKKTIDFVGEWQQAHDRVKSVHDILKNKLTNMETQRQSSDETALMLLRSNWIQPYEIKNLMVAFEQSLDKLSRIADELNNNFDRQNEDNLRIGTIVNDIQDNLRIIRLIPMSTLFDLYPRMVRDICKTQNKKARLVIVGGDTRVDKKVLDELKDPLIHLIRNSIDHGIELPADREAAGKPAEGTIVMKAGYVGNMVQVEISDDGKGIDTERIAQIAVKKGYIKREQLSDVSGHDLIGLIYHSGFSTAKIITDISGRGVGLDIVKANVEKIKGTIETFSDKGKGTKFIIKLPLTLATTHVLIIEVAGETYSIPIDFIERTLRLTEEELYTSGNNPFILVQDKPVPLYKLEDYLGNIKQRLRQKGLHKIIHSEKTSRVHLTKIESNKVPAVVFNTGSRRVAFLIDKLLDEQEVVVKNLGQQLKRVRNVAGCTILGDGRISIILNPMDLVKTVQGTTTKFVFRERRQRDFVKKRVLVVDDSITTRTLEKNILESAGYHVTTATNGAEGFSKLVDGTFDIIVSDVEMPVMNGFEFAEKVRREFKLPDIPFILCTSLEAEKDKRRGIEVGANAYIVKGSFDQSNLLETIERLL